MAETANATLYRDELIQAFERRTAALRPRVTSDGIREGNNFVFLVNGSGSASAVTRGANGKIPSRANDATQVTCTLAEWHDKPQTTKFNIFAGQAGAARRASMQQESVGVLNRKEDDLIVDALEASTQYAGTGTEVLSVSKALHAVTVVTNANAVMSANDVTGLITPAAFAYLVQNALISSKDYVNTSMLPGAPSMFVWCNATWMVHTGLPGNATSSERLFVFHRNAIGFAFDVAGMDVDAGYNSEDAYWWARCSGHIGSKLLQNTGVCSIRHDGSGFAATA